MKSKMLIYNTRQNLNYRIYQANNIYHHNEPIFKLNTPLHVFETPFPRIELTERDIKPQQDII